MSKHNSFIKKIQKQILSVNDLIESYFNKIKYFKSNFKKILLNKENRVILGIGIVVILTLSLFIDTHILLERCNSGTNKESNFKKLQH